MPTNRFQFSDDFVLNANKVGINSSTPQEELDVVGVVKADNLKVTGVSSFTSYEGFLNSNHNITENITLTSGTSGSLSGEIIVGTGITLSGNNSTTSGQGHIDSLKVYNTLTIPVGGTLERPSKSKPGQLYYNKDFSTIEFYDGDRWRQVDNTTRSGRGVFGGGTLAPGLISNISYINISTQGNSLNFGNLSAGNELFGSCSSSTRGIFGGGRVPTYTNAIEYITIASEGNSINFGTLSTIGRLTDSLSSSTRGVFVCGFNPSAPLSGNTNTIDYIQISTLGNALDFGDSSESKRVLGGFASSTRGVFGGGYGAPAPVSRLIEFITISSTGNAIRFGDLTQEAYGNSGCSNSTRGLFGGLTSLNPGNVIHNIIEYVTIASTGNSTDFGDLTIARYSLSASSSQTRAVWCGGGALPAVTNVNTIDFVTIATTGNAIDFGDHLFTGRYGAGCSDSHGGLGGF
jgi:hypothetical protein